MPHTDENYQHALLEIREKLHDPRGSKAAVFVGAGFSRNGVPRINRGDPFPLWRELSTRLAKHLYRSKQEHVLRQAGATSSALRLAQEFEAAFGRSRLIEFVRETVRDDDFQPGSIHHALLELNWADVFTTNFDSLLERAAQSLWNGNYEIVRTINDLPLARRPRIVKLHGSLPELDGMILTEEDYRTYPRRFAPFVAAVQAALTENVLCLVGFSGDDPNFLAWSGWVRDELQSAVPKTYLFTGEELRPFQRRLLEDRHIIPIPLKRIADKSTYSDAYQWLCNELSKRPVKLTPSWNIPLSLPVAKGDPNVSPEPLTPNTDNWVDTAILWREHRQHYQGWHVLHRKGVVRLWNHTEFWIQNHKNLAWDELSEPVAIFVLRELVWRCSAALRPLSDNFVAEIVDPQLKRFVEWRGTFNGVFCKIAENFNVPISEFDDGYEQLLREIIRHAREIADDDRFEHLMLELEQLPPISSDTRGDDRSSFFQYQRILHALGRFDHDDARKRLSSWNTSSVDVIWTLRRAGLCFECGLESLGRRLLKKALKRLRPRSVASTLDIPSMSAEGIALRMHQARELAKPLTPQIAQRHVHESESDGHARQLRRMQTLSRAHDYVKDEPNRTSPSSDKNDRLPVPGEQATTERLKKLSEYGCDPYDHLEWLTLATSLEPQAMKGTRQQEGFNIGSTIESYSTGYEPQLAAAYTAMRFIEDTGLPLTFASEVPTKFCAELFFNSMRTIGFFAPHEAAGLVLRSPDPKAIDAVFSRRCLAKWSESQADHIFEAAFKALKVALNQLGRTPASLKLAGDFWALQIQAACEALSRVVVRLNDQEIASLFQFIIGLPGNEIIKKLRHAHPALNTLIQRTARSLGKAALEQHLPRILNTPVSGSPKLPNSREWYDPVRELNRYQWQRNSAHYERCRRAIDEIVERIRTANNKERRNLCQRAANLLDSGLLTFTQKADFASSLFANVDEFGMPTETGCLDSLILALPRFSSASFDEITAFRTKYLLSFDDQLQLWRELRRTHLPFRQPPQARNVRWTRSDLNTILDFADARLESTQPPSPADSTDSHMADFLTNCVELAELAQMDWLATLENCVLLNRRANIEQQRRAMRSIKQAEHAGWCVTQSVASQVHLKKMTVDEAIREIQCRLGDRNLWHFQQACSAVIQWYKLHRHRELELPRELLQIVATMICSGSHEFLSLLLETCAEILSQLIGKEGHAFLQSIESGLSLLREETEYSKKTSTPHFTISAKLKIRLGCARLVSRANKLNLSNCAVSEWIASIRDDIFADVRCELT